MPKNADTIILRSSSRVIFSVIGSISIMAGFSGVFAYLGLTRIGNDREAVLWFCAALFLIGASAVLFVSRGVPLEMAFAAETLRVRRFIAGSIVISPRDIRRVKIERYIMRARNMSVPRLRLVFEGDRGVLWSVTQDELKEAGTTPAALASLVRAKYCSSPIQFSDESNQR